MSTASTASTPLTGAGKPSTATKPARLISLDLLRGLTIGFMILVNNDGSPHAYWALKHSPWNGFSPTDLVFPTFLFLVGISTVLSTDTRRARGATDRSLFFHTLRRAIILFLLGLVVNSFPFFHLHTMRFYGVLPRIAICYFVVATFYLLSPGWRNKAAVAVAALVGYWILMRFIPVPGYGTPTHQIPLLDHDANLAAWLDRHIFSASHLYERTRDPEGLLSTIPAIATTLMGLLTGFWLRTGNTLGRKARNIAIAGLSCAILGGLWALSFPINKKLWTSSFVLYAGGLSLLLLAAFIWIVDARRSKQTSPSPAKNPKNPPLFTFLLVFGMNAISAYIFSELLASTLSAIHVGPHETLGHWFFLGIQSAVPNPAFASLLYSLGIVAICWLPAYALYRRRIFIKI
jgi:predicted acyltransferase